MTNITRPLEVASETLLHMKIEETIDTVHKLGGYDDRQEVKEMVLDIVDTVDSNVPTDASSPVVNLVAAEMVEVFRDDVIRLWMRYRVQRANAHARTLRNYVDLAGGGA